jgi:hypothetical protein
LSVRRYDEEEREFFNQTRKVRYMRYLLLIYGNESAELNPDEMQKMMGAYNAFTEEVKSAGAMQAAEALQPTATATTVRVRNGETLITDGPFADTKEQLGGFYLLDCKNLDEAVAYAAKIPGAQAGSIEVRPIWEMG